MPRVRALEGPYGSSLREQPTSPLYLYLGRPEWADAWINGGRIPCIPASKFLGDRNGTKTPDEVRQERWDGASESDLAGAITVGPNCRNIRINRVIVNGQMFNGIRVDRYEEDALLLCFSSALDESIMRRFEKMCCVEIIDFDRLLAALENEFPKILHGYMKYTRGDERSHFIRSTEDSWMQEYRIVVPEYETERWVEIPAGIARKIDLSLAA